MEKVFDTYWPQFEKRFKEALKKHPAGQSLEPRAPEDLMGEVLRSVRRIDRRLLDVESSRDQRASESWRMSNRKRATDLSMREMSLTIHTLMEEGLSAEDILEYASDRGIPFDMTKKLMRGYSRTSDVNNKKG